MAAAPERHDPTAGLLVAGPVSVTRWGERPALPELDRPGSRDRPVCSGFCWLDFAEAEGEPEQQSFGVVGLNLGFEVCSPSERARTRSAWVTAGASPSSRSYSADAVTASVAPRSQGKTLGLFPVRIRLCARVELDEIIREKPCDVPVRRPLSADLKARRCRRLAPCSRYPGRFVLRRRAHRG